MSSSYRGPSLEAFAVTHASAYPDAVDYVLDEVKADSTAVAVFDNARATSLTASTTRVGANTVASASGATAIGNGAAAAINSVALGIGASASDYGVGILGAGGAQGVAILGTSTGNGVAIGQTSSAAAGCVGIGVQSATSGGNSVAIGTWSSATGVRSLALGGGANTGEGAKADGQEAIAIGTGSKAPNNYDIAIGFGADSTGGSSSIAIGRDSDATAGNTVAIGHTAVASAAGAIAIGQNATASAADAITIGASYLAGNMVTAKHLSPAAAGAVNLGTTSLPFGRLHISAIGDWAYQRYPAVPFGSGGIGAGTETATTAGFGAATALGFISGAGNTEKAAVSNFTNTGVLSVTVPAGASRTYFVHILGYMRYNVDDTTSDRGAVVFIGNGSNVYVASSVAAKSNRGDYRICSGYGFITVSGGSTYTFNTYLFSAGGLTARCSGVEYHVVQV